LTVVLRCRQCEEGEYHAPGTAPPPSCGDAHNDFGNPHWSGQWRGQPRQEKPHWKNFYCHDGAPPAHHCAIVLWAHFPITNAPGLHEYRQLTAGNAVGLKLSQHRNDYSAYAKTAAYQVLGHKKPRHP